MILDFNKVKSVDDCVEIATMDCYDEFEQASGWLACIVDVFADVKNVKLLGEDVKLAGFDLSGTTVVAICKKNNKKIKLTLDSIELIKPSKVQKLWLEAWLDTCD